MLITSLDNPRVKLLRQLHRRRGRQKAGLYLLEGVRLLQAALDAGVPLDPVFYVPEAAGRPEGEALLARLREAGSRPLAVSPAVLQAVAATENPQGFVAATPLPSPDPAALWQGTPLLLIADRIQDPGNLGTMARTAVAAGAGLIVTSGCVDLFNPKTVRAAAGALFHLRWYPWRDDPHALIRELAGRGVQLTVASLQGRIPYDRWDFTQPTAIVVGNEAAGPSAAWEEAGAASLFIPMAGPVESLNAAAAAAVLLFEAARQV